MRFWMLTLALVVLSPLWADENCEQLKMTLLQVEGLPQKVTAGRDTTPIKFEVTNYAAKLFSAYKNASIMILMSNETPGSWSFTENLSVREAKKKMQTRFETTFKVPKTAQGTYKLELFLQATGDGKECYGKMNSLAEKVIEVPSHPGADIHPPRVIKSRFNTRVAKPNDPVVLSFSVEDPEGSAICTKQSKEQKLCSDSAVNHLELSDKTGEILMNTYEPIVKVGENEYEIRFTVPAKTKPGQYHLQTLNISDHAGNGSTQVSDAEKLTTLDIE